MAKGPLFISTFKGKLGNIVGYTLKDSNDKVVQATRIYQPNVANPKTELQALQRMKMAPAVNFYRQLSQILDNAWQGQKYGNRSRQHFMSLAMKQSTGIPFIVKGDQKFYPGEYPVSQGSLVTVYVTDISSSGLLYTNLLFTTISGETWGDYSQSLINDNFGLKDGDKLTFINVVRTDDGSYVPVYTYIILSTTSSAPATDVLTASHIEDMVSEDDHMAVQLSDVSDVVAGAVIVSRLQGGAWLRSKASLYCADDYKAVMMGQDAYNAAIASYTNAARYVSDWYLNEGIVGETSNYVPGGGGEVNLRIMSIENVNVGSGSAAYVAGVALMSDGTYRALRSNSVPSYVCRFTDGLYYRSGYLGSEIRADDNSLPAIQAVAGHNMAGWVVVNALPAPPENEEPEP